MKQPPNVIVIMTDQHRSDLMSCAGRDLVPTPNIDRIAARGVRLANAYCPYPACLGSRSSLLTGLYAHNTGAINNNDRLDWRFRTIAHHFADCGYLTGLVGKMHFNDGHNHGFEYYLSINDWLMYLGPKVAVYANEIASNPLTTHFYRTVQDDGSGFPDVADLWDGPSPWVGNVDYSDFSSMASKLDARDHLDAFIARDTCRFLQQHREQPFFLVCSFMKPHAPFFPPKEWADAYPVDAETLQGVENLAQYPDYLQDRISKSLSLDARLRRAHQAGYHGNLGFVDSCVGQVCDALDRLNLWDDTIVVYTSDHGEMDGDHGMYQKFLLFDPAVKVPLIICHKGQIPAGEVSDALIEQLGLYPTLVDLTGMPQPERTALAPFPEAPERIDGTSFAKVVREPGSAGASAVFSEFNLRSRNAQYMIRTEQYKYVYNENEADELYDLSDDPGENVNLAQAPGMARVLCELQEELRARYNPETNPYRPS